MLTIGRKGVTAVDDVIDGLPAGFHTVDLGDTQVVVGPTGAFALTDGRADVQSAARRVAQVAARVRDRLCARLSWAPFVDTLVVADGVRLHLDAATVVPRRLLLDVLTGGNPTLRAEDVDRIVSSLEEPAR